jgi:hypothetical protein
MKTKKIKNKNNSYKEKKKKDRQLGLSAVSTA